MEVLWDRREASVRDVVDTLSKERSVAYTSVLTMLKVLSRKGLVEHRVDGRTFIYTPKITRAQARSEAIANVLRQFFNGSPRLLAQHLLEEQPLEAEDLDALARRVESRSDRGDGA